MTKQNAKIILAIVTFSLVALPGVTSAEQVKIEHTISVSSSSGGNVAGEGEVVEGEAKSEVFVETVVNGDVIERYDAREANANVGVSAEVGASAGGEYRTQQFDKSYESADGAVKVETHISTLESGFESDEVAKDSSIFGHPMSKDATTTMAEGSVGVKHPMFNSSGTTASSTVEATTSQEAAAVAEASAAPRSLLQKTFKFIAYVFSFKWLL